MKQGLVVFVAASVPVGALIGSLLGLDARANEWSKRPIYQFGIAGALLIVPVAIYLFRL